MRHALVYPVLIPRPTGTHTRVFDTRKCPRAKDAADVVGGPYARARIGVFSSYILLATGDSGILRSIFALRAPKFGLSMRARGRTRHSADA
eukprot:364342-Chlamydomonas_euryale.AAC.5